MEALESVRLRKALDDDLPFLFQLYCNVRDEEMKTWGWPAEQRDAFLRMQFDARQRSYSAGYPEATDHIVCLGEMPIGRRLVAETTDGVHLVDIALLAEYRHRGIGGRLLRELIGDCQASQKALHLKVFRDNPAIRLYRRMGFTETEDGSMYVEMVWNLNCDASK